jgi:hypothetical protein
MRKRLQLLIEINHLAMRVIDHLYSVHVLYEWPDVRVVEYSYLVILTTMLPKAQDGAFGQLRGVKMHNGYLSLFHIFLGW